MMKYTPPVRTTRKPMTKAAAAAATIATGSVSQRLAASYLGVISASI